MPYDLYMLGVMFKQDVPTKLKKHSMTFLLIGAKNTNKTSINNKGPQQQFPFDNSDGPRCYPRKNDFCRRSSRGTVTCVFSVGVLTNGNPNSTGFWGDQT